MKPPKVYLFDLKEDEIPVLYFVDKKAVGFYCPVCKKQHSHALIPTNQPGTGLSAIAPVDHPVPKNLDWVIMRKEFQEMVVVPREKWINECVWRIESVVSAIKQSDLKDYNVFVFRKILKDGTCEIGAVGTKGTAKKKTNRKLQAAADKFMRRLNNLKVFW